MLPGSRLHEIFEARVREAPNQVAVVAPGERVTYRELETRAGQLAGRLRARGVGPDTLVGLCCPREASLVVGLLGILKAGGAYVPIDPAYPDERIRLLLADSGVPLVVGAGAGADRVHESGAEVVHVDPAEPDRGSGSGPGPDPDPAAPPGAPHHLAYVTYTSGSTGRPKGVQVEHRNVVRLFTSTEPWFRFGTQDVWTMFHSTSFDFSVWEIWGALLHGGRLVIVPAPATRVPAELLTLLREQQVTVLSQTPSAFRQLLLADPDGSRTADLPLRLVVFGGERLDVSLLRPWLERPPDRRPRLVNMYGITETTVHVTYRQVTAADLARPRVSPIGVAIPDLRVTLHDRHGAQVPPGTPGEIWVSGPGVARGYHDRPELTAQRFVTGPDGARAYRSGDRAVRDGGDLVYLGRIDDQIKARGFRVEPYEVEACLSAHPAVAGAVIVGEDTGDWDVRLVAYVQPARTVRGEPGARRLVARLREHAAEHLPEHLRPSDYRLVTEIPRTAPGKVDRAALARTAPVPMPAAAPVRSSDTVREVTRIVEEVLLRDGVAPDQDMFDQGATSLALIRIIVQVNERFAVSLTGGELGDSASIKSLVAALEAAS